MTTGHGSPKLPRVLVYSPKVVVQGALIHMAGRLEVCEVGGANSFSEVARRCAQGEADIVILDHRLNEGFNALSFVIQLRFEADRRKNERLGLIIGLERGEAVIRAMAWAGCNPLNGILHKPYGQDQVVEVLQRMAREVFASSRSE